MMMTLYKYKLIFIGTTLKNRKPITFIPYNNSKKDNKEDFLMDKNKILAWANDLIDRFEESEKTVADETATDIHYCTNQITIECNELRQEIEELLEIN